MSRVKNLTDIKELLRKRYPELKKRYSVSKLGIFGSYAREEQREDSDLDLLVAFETPPSLFKYIELENLLSDTLGIKVDLVMKDALKPGLKDKILHEVQIL